MTEITILYFDGCPSWKIALENVERAVDMLGIPAAITLKRIGDPEQAQKERFLGSPSIRADGSELWPEERADYTLSCRIYQTPKGLSGSPTVEMVCERLRGIVKSAGKKNNSIKTLHADTEMFIIRI